MTPAAFEKHSGRETARKWKNNVWVIVNGVKVPLSKTVLLKYYNQSLKGANGSHRSQIGRVFHRDEFVRCSKCNKERRFRLRTKEECRIHHDSVANASWKCADMPFDKYVSSPFKLIAFLPPFFYELIMLVYGHKIESYLPDYLIHCLMISAFRVT
ncbi:Protein ULTRAPETALA 1 [Linum perenne]